MIPPHQQLPKPNKTTAPPGHPLHQLSTTPPPTPSAPISELHSDDDDILNEKVDITVQLAAMEKANNLIRKYKDNQYIKTNPNSPQSWLMGTIKTIIESTDKIMLPHKYNFMNNREAAKFNTKLLKRERYDLTKVLGKAKGTMMEPGSEFREKDKLEKLFQHHEHWKKMEAIISTGLDYPLTDLPDKVLKEDVIAMIARGNHKSATAPEVAPALLKNYTKEVEHGWMLPVTLESVAKIKGAGVIPIGVAQQQTIDEKGNRQMKFRTTHDASFQPPSEQSINDRLLTPLLSPCFYGHCLIRILHIIHRMRLSYPCVRILIAKIDLDAAYRRIHVVARMAALAITIIKRIAYILLRLPFGVANGPSDYSTISECVMWEQS